MKQCKSVDKVMKKQLKKIDKLEKLISKMPIDDELKVQTFKFIMYGIQKDVPDLLTVMDEIVTAREEFLDKNPQYDMREFTK